MKLLPERIAALEGQLLVTPESRRLREELVILYLEAGLAESHRRYEHILWYVRHHPTRSFARCPFAHVDRRASPEAYAAVEELWRQHVEANPDDVHLVLGLALFVAHEQRERALTLVRRFVQNHPDEVEAWIDLGRMETDANERLAAFQEARSRGSEAPNLVVWIARTAVDANDLRSAETAATHLLQLASAARQLYGERLEWPERGQALYERARAASSTKEQARALVDAISDYSFHAHWAHTVLGVVSLRSGKVDDAVDHLRASAAVRGDYRLSSYGPSFRLADELCSHGRWEEVAEYLEACTSFWDADVLQKLRDEVAGHRHPEFPWT